MRECETEDSSIRKLYKNDLLEMLKGFYRILPLKIPIKR